MSLEKTTDIQAIQAIQAAKLNEQELEKWSNKMEDILKQKFKFHGDGPSEIIPCFLWLGDCEDASNLHCLQQHGITWILNCAGNDVNVAYPAQFRVHRVNAADHRKYDMLGQHMYGCRHFIDECRRSEQKILIHCVAGMNRSATITVAYLMHYFADMNLLQAVQHTVNRRCWILTNGGFRRQLIQYAHLHKKLFGATSVRTSVTDLRPITPRTAKL